MKDLVIRTLTGTIFVAIIVGGIWINAYSFLAVFCLVVGLSIWEFQGLVKYENNSLIRRIVSLLAGVYLFFASFTYASGLMDEKIYLPYLLFLMLTFIAELYGKASNPVRNWACTLLSQLYCAGSFSLLNFLVFASDTPGEVTHAPLLALALFVFVWINDTGAFLVGSTLGKHKLFERISPKKSWEGFWGGLIAGILSSFLFARYVPEISWYNWLGLSVVTILFATWGDLTESLLKRTAGVKDSGNILPGHGGILDRFDSAMMAIPAAYIYIELFIRN